MRIDLVQGNSQSLQPTRAANGPEKGAKSFAETLTQAVEQVNELQQQADQLAVKVATGDVENVHQAAISMEKAVLALEFAVQVRNKAIEAYQELMRTQV